LSTHFFDAISQGEAMRAILTAACAIGLSAGLAQAALVSQWTFDDTPNDAVGTRHLTLNGSTSYSTNVPKGNGKSLALSGGWGSYDVTAPDIISGTFSIAAWVNSELPGINGSHAWIGSRGPSDTSFDAKFWRQSETTKRIHGDIGTGTSWLTNDADVSPFDFQPGVWYHITYVVQPGSYQIFVNGVLAASGVFGGGDPLLIDENHDLGIGAISVTGGENFHGFLDDVRIYDHALTSAEILSFIPEPNALSLLAAGGLLAVRRRRA
jgi:hypothetical protein